MKQSSQGVLIEFPVHSSDQDSTAPCRSMCRALLQQEDGQTLQTLSHGEAVADPTSNFKVATTTREPFQHDPAVRLIRRY